MDGISSPPIINRAMLERVPTLRSEETAGGSCLCLLHFSASSVFPFALVGPVTRAPLNSSLQPEGEGWWLILQPNQSEGKIFHTLRSI